MPIATAEKITALSHDLGSQRHLAELLGVSPAQVTRWRRGGGAKIDGPGGPLWFPREQQGAGRHDNPDLYGCLYASAEQVSAVAEMLAPFRGHRNPLAIDARSLRPAVGARIAGVAR